MSSQAVAARERTRRPEWFSKAPAVELDVNRIAAGDSFFVHVMDAVERIVPGQVLSVRTDFEPTLLCTIMDGKGFECWPECEAQGDWMTRFHRRRVA